MTRSEHRTGGAAELEQFLVSLTASRARLEALSRRTERPELTELTDEVDILTEQLLTADAELRAQEDELAELTRRAEHAVHRWEKMFARSRTAYYLTDGDGVVVDSNLAARRLFHDPETAPTQLRPVGSRFAVDDRASIRAAVRRAVVDGESATVRTSTHARAGGDARAVDVTVTRVHEPGEPVTLWWQIVPLEHGAVEHVTSDQQRAADLPRLVETFSGVAEAVHRAEGAKPALHRIVELIPELIPTVEWVGITTVRRGRPSTVAASSPVAEQVDALQHRTGEGPCLDALLNQATYCTGNLGLEPRWPVFGRLCVEETPVRSVLAFQLPIDDQVTGALNCYSSAYDAFTDESMTALGALFAAHTGLALAATHRQEQAANLTVALENSRLIGAAVGILMAHHRVTQAQAFDLLRDASQRSHRKLREIADDVVRTGVIG